MCRHETCLSLMTTSRFLPEITRRCCAFQQAAEETNPNQVSSFSGMFKIASSQTKKNFTSQETDENKNTGIDRCFRIRTQTSLFPNTDVHF